MKTYYIQKNKGKDMAYFSLKITQSEDNRATSLKHLHEKNCHPRILYLTKVTFQT